MKIGKICVHIYLHAPIQIIHNKLWYMYKTTGLQTKRRRSDPVLWQETLYQQKCTYWAICSQRVLHVTYKLNPVTRISRNSSAGRTQRLWFKDCWFDPTVLHYFSPTRPPLFADWWSIYSWWPRVKMTEALRIKYIRSILVWEKGFILRSFLSCSNRPGPALIAINSSNYLLTF